jgi:DNA-binding transcriptional MerR regulator
MTIQELADRAAVTTRTIRYYVEQGVLPPPERGRPAEYTEEHVQWLELIRRLKEQYLPLEEIRDTMQRLSLDEVERLVEQHSPRQEESGRRLDSAADYIAGVLGRGIVREQMKKQAPASLPEGEKRRTVDEELPATDSASVPPPGGGMRIREDTPTMYSMPAPAPAPVGAPLPSSSLVRRPLRAKSEAQGDVGTYIPSPTTWQRVELGEGVELNFVASDDARFTQRVARLIEAARRILGSDPGNGEETE